MTGNRLIERFAAPSETNLTDERLRELCWERNQWARRIGWSRWYMVAHKNGQPAIDQRDGHMAETVWRLLSGWRPDYHGWPADRLASEFRIVRHVASMGMPEDEFKQFRMAA